MRKLNVYIISTVIIFLLCLLFGLYCKSTYEDFNSKSDPLNEFTVGLISEEMCQDQVIMMKNSLANSNYIVAVEVVSDLKFLHSCTTQKVKIINVFKGDEISTGEIIDLVISNEIFWDETSFETEGACINMGFINKLNVGETYLLFLDHEIETYNSNRLFIKAEKYILSPFFSYDNDRIGWGQSESSIPEILECSYASVSQYDYFLSSQKSSDLIKALRLELINRYRY